MGFALMGRSTKEFLITFTSRILVSSNTPLIHIVVD
jgi:hypothetical protein